MPLSFKLYVGMAYIAALFVAATCGLVTYFHGELTTGATSVTLFLALFLLLLGIAIVSGLRFSQTVESFRSLACIAVTTPLAVIAAFALFADAFLAFVVFVGFAAMCANRAMDYAVAGGLRGSPRLFLLESNVRTFAMGVAVYGSISSIWWLSAGGIGTALILPTALLFHENRLGNSMKATEEGEV